MSQSTALIFSDSYQDYNFSPWHPMKPARLLLTAELIKAYGITDQQNSRIIEPRLATVDELNLVHDLDYVEKVKELSQPGADESGSIYYGLGTGDNPIFPRMHEASATIAGASLLGAEKIMAGELDHSFNVAGGLHHAQHNRASGFCVYNDVAIAIAWLRKNHGARVVYIDVDAHHGDGVQNAFYHDPEVMTISFHESGRSLFPGTGFVAESGEGAAKGTSVNLPLASDTGDDIFLEAYDALVPPLVRAFNPGIIVTQCGCDGHWDDPLTHLALTLKGYQLIWQRMHALAHEVTGGRWLATGGGGYQAFLVVPRAWTALMTELAGVEVAEELPQKWRDLYEKHAGVTAPVTLTGENPPAIAASRQEMAREAAARGVAEIRAKIFPLVDAS